MTPKRFMVIAGEASGDMLAAELVRELRAGIQRQPTYTNDLQPLQADLAPRFFGAGGPCMAAAGVELAFDMTSHAVVGLVEVIKRYGKFKRLFDELFQMAVDREPHVIICVDFSGFNRRFAHAIKKYVRQRRGPFFDWNPKIIQYVSPQVWASREGRARQVAEDFNLILSIIPFEKAWYEARYPKLKVEFVGHPMLDRYGNVEGGGRRAELTSSIVLLPGSRKAELERHLPVMLPALRIIQAAQPGTRATMILPNESLAKMVGDAPASGLKIQVGGLAEALAQATVAIASTGTVTMECAYFGVPTVTLYRTSWSTYQIGRRIIKVKSLTMPNLLANEEIYPEFIQAAATPENISRATLEFLRNEPARNRVKEKLTGVITSLGGPGASRRAAEAILRIL
ncbi:MAG: Lipid-A-disaccharide synthase [Pedosphaera sp.]|nr:Lipid-A-disaccharide synthase [Pedosphaera sp.]